MTKHTNSTHGISSYMQIATALSALGAHPTPLKSPSTKTIKQRTQADIDRIEAAKQKRLRRANKRKKLMTR